MASATSQRLADGTIELTITIPWPEVSQTYETVVESMAKSSELPGFRQGKAPRKLIEEKLDKTKIYEEVLKQLIPKVYNETITAQRLHPIVTPKVELKEANEGKDWLLRILTCEKPKVNLGDWRRAISELNAVKQKKIWLPGQAPQGEEKPDQRKPTLDELLKALYGSLTIALPTLILELEVNRLLAELIDQTKKLGLTIEQYLASTGRTAESLRQEYTDQAKRTLTLEFALTEIADSEGILVSDDDIEAAIKTAKTEDERKSLNNQRYYLASILRRQKTLDFLSRI